MEFVKIKPTDAGLLMPHLSKLSFVDTGFTALYYVADSYDLHYGFIEGSLAVSFDMGSNTEYTMFGVEHLKSAVDELAKDGEVQFICVPERELYAYRAIEGYAADITYESMYSDYICRYEDFVSLSGRYAQRKRKDYDRFVSRNDYAVREISLDNLGDVRMLMERWCEGRNCADCEFDCEKKWVIKLLDAWHELPAKGLIVDIDGRPEGFAIAELCGETMLRLVGKPVGRQEGLHAFLGVETALRQFSDAKYINSGPDLGRIGLATMKRKFKPYTMADKYTVTLTKKVDNGEEAHLNAAGRDGGIDHDEEVSKRLDT